MTRGEERHHELILPIELVPPSVKHLPLEKRIELWAELVDENDALVRAGLKAKLGQSGNLEGAYREWYARHMEEHERAMAGFAENLARREASHGK